MPGDAAAMASLDNRSRGTSCARSATRNGSPRASAVSARAVVPGQPRRSVQSHRGFADGNGIRGRENVGCKRRPPPQAFGMPE